MDRMFRLSASSEAFLNHSSINSIAGERFAVAQTNLHLFELAVSSDEPVADACVTVSRNTTCPVDRVPFSEGKYVPHEYPVATPFLICVYRGGYRKFQTGSRRMAGSLEGSPTEKLKSRLKLICDCQTKLSPSKVVCYSLPNVLPLLDTGIPALSDAT